MAESNKDLFVDKFSGKFYFFQIGSTFLAHFF